MSTTSLPDYSCSKCGANTRHAFMILCDRCWCGLPSATRARFGSGSDAVRADMVREWKAERTARTTNLTTAAGDPSEESAVLAHQHTGAGSGSSAALAPASLSTPHDA